MFKNLKMKYIKHYIFILGSILLFATSCTKNFDEINTNPDKSTSTSAEGLAANMLTSITSSDIGDTKGFMQTFMLSKYILWTEKQEGFEFNKIGRAGFGRLSVLRNVPVMMQYANKEEDGIRNAYAGLGHFIRAWQFFQLTMQLGDIPYSEAIKGETDGIIKPKYDLQKEVFQGILRELDSANLLFAKGADFKGDFIFKGSVDKWQRLTNSFELHVLMQLSKKADDPDLKVGATFKQIAETRPLMRDYKDNFAVTYQNSGGYCYPWSNTPVQVNSFAIYPVVSANLIDPLKRMQDRRLFYYTEPAQSKIKAGSLPSEYNAYIGVEAADPIAEVKSAHDNGAYCDVNKRYVELFNPEPVGLFNYWDLQFVLAEGAVRGWLPAASANGYYEAGIKGSMDFLKDLTDIKYTHGMPITDSYLTDYLNREALSGNSDHKIEQIITQKYLANFLQDVDYTAWFENRRTGYPKFILNPATNLNQPNTKFPLRWLYPQDELDHNSENVAAAIERQYGGNDNVNNVMWLIK